MTCDEVFNELSRTRRTAETAALHNSSTNSDDAVHQHLDSCESCAHIAELFRPAVEFISSDVQASVPSSAPSLWQSIRESAEVANREAARLSRPSQSNSVSHKHWGRLKRSFQVVTLLLVGLGVGAFVNREMVANVTTAGPGACNHLMMTIAEQGDNCPTCQQPCEMTARQVTALCMACHVAPDLTSSFTETSFLVNGH